MAQKRKLAAAMFSLGCLHAGSVWALGLGELTLESFLNEPLRAKVDLLNTGGLHEDQIRVRLATSEDFDRLGVDRAYFLTGIKFDIEIDAKGHGVILLSSDDPVLEPYLDFILETRWPSGRLLREYTILVDPPTFDQSSPVVSASQRVEEVEGIPGPTKKKSDSQTRENPAPRQDASGNRDFGAQSAASPTPGSRYLIQRDETLWQIALQAKPEGVSAHQTMLEIQRLNPDAFIDNNINRIKAGYVIYLPSSGEVSSDDEALTLAEITQQNDDWRAGRAGGSNDNSGPALRISAGTDVESESDAANEIGNQNTAAATAAALEDLEKSELEREELSQRLASLSDQVTTLERIVAVKDSQIAALQAALGGDEQNLAAGDTSDQAEAPGVVPAPTASSPASTDVSAPATDAVAATTPEGPATTSGTAVAEPGLAGVPAKWLYLLGGISLAALLALLWRRRRAGDEQDSPTTVRREASSDAFAGVELKDQELDVDDSIPTDAAFAVDSVDELEELTSRRDNRGYGERKHDEYASDVDAGDALAEADIYIAYGRYPQAIDLLQTAIKAEPGNAAYRLKLLELCVEAGRPDEAARQYSELRAINDPRTLERATAVMAGIETQSDDVVDAIPELRGLAGDDALPPGADFGDDLSRHLDPDFSELELGHTADELGGNIALDEETNNEDFTLDELDEDDEALVFAAEGSQVSTKLDLARAYIDMGDEDGARQILEEVTAEGSAEQQAEARSLMERFG